MGTRHFLKNVQRGATNEKRPPKWYTNNRGLRRGHSKENSTSNQSVKDITTNKKKTSNLNFLA